MKTEKRLRPYDAPACHSNNSYSSRLLPLIPILASALVQSPILSYFFYKDDFFHFYHAANTGFFEFLLTPYGGHLCIIRNFFIFILYNMFGMASELHFSVVLITHLINVFLLFHFIKNLTSSPYLAVFGATLWGMYPVNQGSIGWYSVYGHVLTCTWLLWILYDVSSITQNGVPLTRRKVVKWHFLLFVAAASFGIGVGIATLFTPVIWLFLYGEPTRTRVTRGMLYMVFVVPLMYLLLHWLHHVFTGTSDSIERLELQFSYVFPYLFEIFSMFFGMVSYCFSSLIFGPFFSFGHQGILVGPLHSLGSKEIFALSLVILTLFSIYSMWVFIRTSSRQRCQILALALLISITYGIIAVGRAAHFVLFFHRTIDQIVIQHQYHYVGPMLFSALFCLILSSTKNYWSGKGWGPSSVKRGGFKKTNIFISIIFFLVSIAFIRQYYIYKPMELTISIKGASRFCRVFYDTGAGIFESKPIQKIVTTRDKFTEISYHIPAKHIRYLRIDPGSSPGGRALVKRICFTNRMSSEKRLCLSSSEILENFYPYNDISRFKFHPVEEAVLVESSGNYPFFISKISFQNRIAGINCASGLDNYLVALILSILLYIFLNGITTGKITDARSFLVIWLAFTIIPYYRVSLRILPNRGFKEKIEYDKVISEIREEIYKHPKGSDVYISNKSLYSISMFVPKGEPFPKQASLFVIAFPKNTVDGRRVYFVEKDPELLEKVKKRRDRRIYQLLISPEHVPE